MKIQLSDSIAKKKHYRIEQSIRVSDCGPFLRAEVDGKLLLSHRQDEIYGLDGNLVALVSSQCGRCGKEIRLSVEQEFHYQLRVEEEPQLDADFDATDEDYEVVYLLEPTVDSSSIVKEQLLLALPTSCLCVEDCKGLCDRCGVNLNEMQCKCKESNENSPFAILKNLQEK